jgi:Arc/MetJ-type ribon-helix-helix transcriptional regulator
MISQSLGFRADQPTIDALDALVAAGPVGLNRSDYIRRAVTEMLERGANSNFMQEHGNPSLRSQ